MNVATLSSSALLAAPAAPVRRSAAAQSALRWPECAPAPEAPVTTFRMRAYHYQDAPYYARQPRKLRGAYA